MSADRDHRIRLAAFQWLRAQMDIHGDVLPRSTLAQGFVFEDTRVRCSDRKESSSPGS
jgi:hypothetical protein